MLRQYPLHFNFTHLQRIMNNSNFRQTKPKMRLFLTMKMFGSLLRPSYGKLFIFSTQHVQIWVGDRTDDYTDSPGSCYCIRLICTQIFRINLFAMIINEKLIKFLNSSQENAVFSCVFGVRGVRNKLLLNKGAELYLLTIKSISVR